MTTQQGSDSGQGGGEDERRRVGPVDRFQRKHPVIGMPIAVVTAMWPSLVGVWLFPANGSQIAAVETDRTGTTRLSSLPIWHSFTIPMLVAWVSVVAVGLLMSLVVH